MCATCGCTPTTTGGQKCAVCNKDLSECLCETTAPTAGQPTTTPTETSVEEKPEETDKPL